MTLWKQCLRDTRADYQHSQGWERVKGSANNSAVCEPTQQVIGDKTVQSMVNSSGREMLSGSSPSGRAPIPPISHHRSETQHKNGSQGLGNRPCPWQGLTHPLFPISFPWFGPSLENIFFYFSFFLFVSPVLSSFPICQNLGAAEKVSGFLKSLSSIYTQPQTLVFASL